MCLNSQPMKKRSILGVTKKHFSRHTPKLYPFAFVSPLSFSILSLLTISYSLLTVNCSAQPVEQEWVARYMNADGVPRLWLDKLGNIYMCGGARNTTTQGDYLPVKYNSTGDTLWSARYDNANNENREWALAVDSIGNAYITGLTSPSVFSIDCPTELETSFFLSSSDCVCVLIRGGVHEPPSIIWWLSFFSVFLSSSLIKLETFRRLSSYFPAGYVRLETQF
jgi:hypothetical protein